MHSFKHFLLKLILFCCCLYAVQLVSLIKRFYLKGFPGKIMTELLKSIATSITQIISNLCFCRCY